MVIRDLLTDEVFAVLLVFLRIGGALLLMPGFAEPYVLARWRLLFALALSLALALPLAPSLPPMPAALPATIVLLMHELLIGLFIGASAKAIFATLHIAGSIIAVQSG